MPDFYDRWPPDFWRALLVIGGPVLAALVLVADRVVRWWW
jgi:hypothetical protein